MSTRRQYRGELKGHEPCVVWFTGLSGAGKTTIAVATQQKLLALGKHSIVLDGDDLRRGLSSDLGFTNDDRAENTRRAAEVAALMVEAGLIVLVALISPFRAERRFARDRVRGNEFVEVFVDTPLAVAESRDAKGLYAKARRGELPNFTGIDSVYEPPLRPDLRIDTVKTPVEEAVDTVISALRARSVSVWD